MKIRRATSQDGKAISKLITGLAHFFTIHPQGLGAETFMVSIGPDAIEEYIESADFDYYAGWVEQQLAGVVAMRNGSHLYHLFVAEAFQGRGYSRVLWQHALANIRMGTPGNPITVSATPYAVAIYERFGFKAAGSLVEQDGIRFLPMQLERSKGSGAPR